MSNLSIWSQVQVLQPSTVASFQSLVPAEHPLAQFLKCQRGSYIPYTHSDCLEKYSKIDPSRSDIGVTSTVTPRAISTKSSEKIYPKKWYASKKKPKKNVTPLPPSSSSHSEKRKFKPYDKHSPPGLASEVQSPQMKIPDTLLNPTPYPENEEFSNLGIMDMSKITALDENEDTNVESSDTQRTYNTAVIAVKEPLSAKVNHT